MQSMCPDRAPCRWWCTFYGQVIWVRQIITFKKEEKLCKFVDWIQSQSTDHTKNISFLLHETFGPELFHHNLSTVMLCNMPPYQCIHPGSLNTNPFQTLASVQPRAIWAATTGRRHPLRNEMAILSPLARMVWPCPSLPRPVLSPLMIQHLLIQVSHHTNSSFPHTWALWPCKSVFYFLHASNHSL